MARDYLCLVRTVLFSIIRWSGLPFLIRETVYRNKTCVIIYHSIDFKTADRHMAALTNRYSMISLSDYLAARQSGQTHRLPPKSLVVTIDDGWASTSALEEIFVRYNMKPTVFLCSDIVGTSRHFWFRHESVWNSAQTIGLLPDSDRLSILSETGYSDEIEYVDRHALSIDEIAKLIPIVDFQSHTRTHAILPRCDTAKAESEIMGSKSDLEAKFGVGIYALAYPFGDVTDREVEIAKRAGYQCGLTAVESLNNAKTDIFRICRICIPDDAGVNEMLVRASGLWALVNRARHFLSRRSMPT